MIFPALPSLTPEEIQQRMAFLEITDRDAALLHHYRRHFTGACYQIIQAFYTHLSQFPPSQSLLTKPGAIANLSKIQRRYWQRFFSGRYDASYVSDRLKIGTSHYKVGLELKWYSSSYAWFLVKLTESAFHQETLALAEKIKLISAFTKLVFFDLSLAVESYVEADRHQLESVKNHLQRVLDTVPEAILLLTTQGRIQACNPAAVRLFGHPQEAFSALPVNQLLTDESGRPLEFHELLTHLWHPDSAPCPALAVKNQAQAVPVEVTIAQLPEDQPRYLLVVRDVSRQKQVEAKLSQLAKFDPVTTLPNRALFFDLLAQELARSHRYQNPLAVLFLDLDNFKKINDSFGHLTGDLLLKQVALRLKRVLRETDTIARFGGDEFTICLPDLKTAEGYLPIVTKLRKAFASPFRLGTQEVFVSASIGIALSPHHGTDPDTLLKHADVAMYEAKRKRLGHYCYNTALEEAAIQQITFEKELYRALERGEFYLVYQPQVCLHSGRITGVEALLRWRNPSLGSPSPSRFIPYLEHTGLIKQVGKWAFSVACAQIRKWQETLGIELTLAVNLSASQIAQIDFSESLYREISRLGLAPELLELEITETTLMEQNEITCSNLQFLHAMGVHLAIDDFGIGYSSLGYLKAFPFHTLKIDKSFIQQLTTKKDQELARHIVGIGKSLELKVIVEGVETKAQLALVRELGCDLAQGYLFSPPLEASELTNRLKSSTQLLLPLT